MNMDILKGNWKQMKGQVQKTWGKLTDDELDEIQGDTTRLVGKLQAKYGYTKEEAEKEVNEFLSKEQSRIR